MLTRELICCGRQHSESTCSQVLPLEKEWERERLCCSLLTGDDGGEKTTEAEADTRLWLRHQVNLRISCGVALPVSTVLLSLERE